MDCSVKWQAFEVQWEAEEEGCRNGSKPKFKQKVNLWDLQMPQQDENEDGKREGTSQGFVEMSVQSTGFGMQEEMASTTVTSNAVSDYYADSTDDVQSMSRGVRQKLVSRLEAVRATDFGR